MIGQIGRPTVLAIDRHVLNPPATSATTGSRLGQQLGKYTLIRAESTRSVTVFPRTGLYLAREPTTPVICSLCVGVKLIESAQFERTSVRLDSVVGTAVWILSVTSCGVSACGGI